MHYRGLVGILLVVMCVVAAGCEWVRAGDVGGITITDDTNEDISVKERGRLRLEDEQQRIDECSGNEIVVVHQRDYVRGELGEGLSDAEVDTIGYRLGSLSSPIEGARLPSLSHLPGSSRAYRHGIHQGIDFYDGHCGTVIVYGGEVVAAGDGIVVRSDVDYAPLSGQERDELLQIAGDVGYTSDDVLDYLHGQQVWVDHGEGLITRYSHLAGVNCEVGDVVRVGDVIGWVGNSGTSAEIRETREGAHLHFEIFVDSKAFWDGMSIEQIKDVVGEMLDR